MTSPLLITSMMAGQRLDRLFRKLCKHNPAIQLGHIFKAIRQADVRVKSANEDTFHKSSGEYMLQIGDTVLIKDIFLNTINSKALVVRAEGTYRKKGDLQRAPRQTTNFVFKDLIIRQTDDRLVIDKPAGISMHPSENNNELNSLHDLLKQYYSGLGFAGTSFQPNFCYRLDKDTSGVCIVGKTFPALQHLNAEIRDRKVDKVYMAWVHGTRKDTLRCTQPLKRVVDKQFGRGKTVVADDGQEASTYAYVVKTMMHPILGDISLCEVTIQTGRMHQIRVHLAHAGHHIVGDMIYGQPSAVRKAKEKAGVKRQLLHCYQYSFIDVDGSKISFKTPTLPADFQDIEKIPPK